MTTPSSLMLGWVTIRPKEPLRFIQVDIVLKPSDPDDRFREIIDEVE